MVLLLPEVSDSNFGFSGFANAETLHTPDLINLTGVFRINGMHQIVLDIS
jgi:hypothetical protein